MNAYKVELSTEYLRHRTLVVADSELDAISVAYEEFQGHHDFEKNGYKSDDVEVDNVELLEGPVLYAELW